MNKNGWEMSTNFWKMENVVALLTDLAGHRVVRCFQNKATHSSIRNGKLQSPQLMKEKYGMRNSGLIKICFIRYYTSMSLPSFQAVKQFPFQELRVDKRFIV